MGQLTGSGLFVFNCHENIIQQLYAEPIAIGYCRDFSFLFLFFSLLSFSLSLFSFFFF